MSREFIQRIDDPSLERDFDELLRLAVREDVETEGDLTTEALVPPDARGRAELVVRQGGVIAGLPLAATAFGRVDERLQVTLLVEDGCEAEAGTPIARVEGPAASLLQAERPVLNLLGRLSGVATLTRRYVEAVAGTNAHIYDTRKTTPGWRRLEKYAVCRGGGCNHRIGLFDAVLIKDNHLAFGAQLAESGKPYTPAEAVARSREFLAERFSSPQRERPILEIEVDTLGQLGEVLPAGPDIVLLDNMTPAELCRAVAIRNRGNPRVELEASGGVTLATVGEIAQSGVDRISVGALTHSAKWLDIGMDWLA